MSFGDIKGQDSAISFLKGVLKSGRLSHAYIFCGPDGVGKLGTALNFAKALNCDSSAILESHPSTGSGCENAVSYAPCEKCGPCLKINAKVHPDLLILKPDKEGGSIKIDDVRQLIKDIYLKPFEARKKVYIIDGAESMKHEAANALLKTLEEPPTDSVLILIAENLKALFHTIVSRSQVVRFFPLKAKEIKDILVREHSLDEVKAHVLSHLSGGRLGEALRFKDEEIFERRQSLISGASKGFLTETPFDDIPKDGIRLCLDILLSYFRDVLNTKAGAGGSALINIDKKEMIYSDSKRLSFEYLEDAINNIISTLSYLDQNANAKLAMSVLGLKIVGHP